MKKLWQKAAQQTPLLVENYTSGEDILLDQKLIPYDIYGSIAHTKMLHSIHLLNVNELRSICDELQHILGKYKVGEYTLQFGDEDVHTRIENDVSAKYPEAGAKMHTGRSRNDQVLVDLRLYTKDHLHFIAEKTLSVLEHFAVLAKKYEAIPMPGYTHMQPAMLSSVGLWLEQFAESFSDDMKTLENAYELNDQSPLGSGAGYGVSLPLNRELTAGLLGFAKLQSNSLYCQNSRGKIEGAVLHALTQIMLTCGRFAQDMLVFTMDEFQFFSLPAELTTGSSIMPQKRNFDIFELIRARAKVLINDENQVLSIVAGLPSGYNRDLQEIKKPYFGSFEVTEKTLEVMDVVLTGLQVHKENMEKRITPELFAAHYAYEVMTKNHLPFREAYQKVGKQLDSIPKYDANSVLAQSKHIGATGNLRTANMRLFARREKRRWQERQRRFEEKLHHLLTRN